MTAPSTIANVITGYAPSAANGNVDSRINNIYPLTPVAGALGCTANGTGYVYSQLGDQYSATIPASIGKNVSASTVVSPSAISTNQAGFASSMDRSFDRNLNWNNIEQSAGNYTWAALDAWVAATAAAGKDMIYVVFGTPAFYTSSLLRW